MSCSFPSVSSSGARRSRATVDANPRLPLGDQIGVAVLRPVRDTSPRRLAWRFASSMPGRTLQHHAVCASARPTAARRPRPPTAGIACPRRSGFRVRDTRVAFRVPVPAAFAAVRLIQPSLEMANSRIVSMFIRPVRRCGPGRSADGR